MKVLLGFLKTMSFVAIGATVAGVGSLLIPDNWRLQSASEIFLFIMIMVTAGYCAYKRDELKDELEYQAMELRALKDGLALKEREQLRRWRVLYRRTQLDK